MRSTLLLTQLALCTSTGYAFIPFTPAWKAEADAKSKAERDGLTLDIKRVGRDQTRSSLPRSVAREAQRLANKYAERWLSHGAGLSKRENHFSIMKSTASGGSMTAGIEQDGSDYSYFVQVQMGSKGKGMYMLIDTGAGSSWLVGPDCTSNACKLHNSFGSEDSDTFEPSSKDFSVSYGTGEVSGTLATDTIGLAGMSFKYQFGSATETSDDFEVYAFDGILGLSMTDGANENFLKVMDESNQLKWNAFAVALNRASDGSNNGEISFGKTNSKLYTGDITYTGLSSDTDWAVDCDEISYDGKKAGVGGMSAYIDTGTSFIFGPPDAVKKIHSLIDDAESDDDMSYFVPCDSDKSLTVTFSGASYEISPQDWISPPDNNGKCTSNVYGMPVVDGAWLFGDTFLKNVYSIFDLDKKQIGFASRSSQSQASSTTSTSVTSATATTSKTSTTASVTSHSASSSKTRTPMGMPGHEIPTSTSSSEKPTKTTKKNAALSGQVDANRLVAVLCLSLLLALLV